jgi:hypothetical protein
MPAPGVPPLVVVVSHTHWDREWYRPFEAFRLLLVETVESLLGLLEREPGFGHFMLDGQTIVLEDVLALRPDLMGRLLAQVAQGRLGIGPWYVLADEFLVGGESLVRNLAEGMRVARRFGRPLGIGYLPDAFGHAAQLPRILAGFGIDTCVLWRGVGDRAPGSEWRWRALDGTEVLCLWLPEGYGNAAGLPDDPAAALARLRADCARLGPQAPSGVILWMNGNDHAAAQPHLATLLAALRAAAPELEIVHGGLEEAARRVRERVDVAALQVVEGELRRPSASAPLLPGVLSTRSWQKRAHDRAEGLLARIAEPLCALAGLDRRPALRHAWRLLATCQPHDSICGCSIDGVHRDVAARLRRVVQVGRALGAEAVRRLAGDVGSELDFHGGVAIASPHPFAASALAAVELGRPPAQPFRLLGPAGEVPYDLVSCWDSEKGTDPMARLGLRIFAADLPPHGLRTLAIAPGAPAARLTTLGASEDSVENGRLRLRARPGGLEIVDLQSGARVVHTFEDQADRGDAYDFCALSGDEPRSSREASLTPRARLGRAAATLELVGRWLLPRALDARRRQRVGQAALPFRLRATLPGDRRRVELDLTLWHRLCDHRLRLRLETSPPPASLWTDTPFGWLERPPGGPHPVSSITVAPAGPARLGVGALGLHEVELATDGALVLTLLRAVGFMSRSDLASRPGHAGYQVRVPGAQGRGRLRYRYVLVFGEPGEPAAALARELEPALFPPLAVGLQTGEALDRPLLEVAPAAVRLYAVKRADEDDRLLVRLGGPESGTVQARVRFFGRQVRRAWLSDLDERLGTPLAPSPDGTVVVPLPAGEVATVAVELS